MDLDDLHIFRSVVQAGGVTHAAARLHRVPSNITTRIKQLEDRLGTGLFRRQGRGLVLTEAGKTLLGHAERILRLADIAEQDLRGGGVQGTLRIGSLESAAGVRLPPILSDFHARFPDVSIELQTGTTAALLDRLERFEIEAAFVSEPFDADKFASRPAFVEELVLISAKGATTVTDPAALSGTTVLAFPHGCSYRRRLVDWLAGGGASPDRILDLGSYHAIVACVAAGTGVGIVPAAVLDHAVLGTSVQRHALPDGVRHNRTHLVWLGEASASLLALMDLMQS